MRLRIKPLPLALMKLIVAEDLDMFRNNVNVAALVNRTYDDQFKDAHLWDDGRVWKGFNVHSLTRGKCYAFRADCDECRAEAWERMTFAGFNVARGLA